VKKILVFASGTIDGGGSGFQELVENTKTGILQAKIVAVVSNHKKGGVFQKAKESNVDFEYFSGPYNTENYQKLIRKYQPDLVCLSGWLKLVQGLDPKKTINIHPGILPILGGKGMYGINVHKKAVKLYKQKKIAETAVSMHFVTEKYDDGPVFFKFPVLIRKTDTPETLQSRVNKIEHAYQSYITNLVLQGLISWDGKNPKTLKLPNDYKMI